MQLRQPTKPPSPLSLVHPKPSSSTLKFLLISMATVLSLALLSLVLFFSLSSARHHRHHLSPPIAFPNQPSPQPSMASTPSPEIQQACKATRDPPSCEASLLQSNQVPPNPTPLQIIQSAMWVSSQNLKTVQSMVKTILDSSAGNFNRSLAAESCLEILHNSEYRISSTADALTRGRIKDARAWTSAGLAYQYGCWSGLKYVNDSQLVNETMAFMDSLIGLTSNALSMILSYDVFGNETGSWGPPMTERDGFWERVDGTGDGSGLGYKGGFPSGLKPDVTVCKAGGVGCDYTMVQEAVNAAPDNVVEQRFVIRINEGVYEETVRVPLEKRNVVFLGDGIGKTVITGSSNVGQPGISTYNSATVGVLGDGFMASGITFQNTAGPDAHQAVAFRSDSDLSIIENSEFIGNQDTLYAQSLRQYYKSCRIQGNVDFIFGNSASIFQDCLILISPRQLQPEHGEDNTVTAHGRTDPAQSTGFIFQNCVVNGTDEYIKLYYNKSSVHKNFLGRPWKEYSRTVFVHCTLEALIIPQGWMPWSGDFALKTLYYGEFESSGSGANISGRVTWSSQIPTNHICSYSVHNFIQGDEWIPTSS